MELVSWISPTILSDQMLQFNPNAIDYIEKENICMSWTIISCNPGALKYLYRDPSLLNKGCWFNNKNPAIIPLLEEHCDYIKSLWIQRHLLDNPNAIHLLDTQFIKHHLYKFCKNTNPLAIDLIDYYLDKAEDVSNVIWDTIGKNPSALKLIYKYMDKMSWKALSENPAAIHLLLQNPDEIRWVEFSKNTHPLAIEHIRKNLDKVDWVSLNMNPSAIEILKENQDKIIGYWISYNPAIFEYNYLKMALERMDILRDELLSISLHPSRVIALMKQGFTLAEL
jgi:hypothetical protein